MCTVIPPTFDALRYISTKENQLKVVQLSIFEATYHDNVTSLTLDMYSLIIDTGASLTISPRLTDFTSPICLVQMLKSKETHQD
jgi:hypothetical protein